MGKVTMIVYIHILPLNIDHTNISKILKKKRFESYYIDFGKS